jgi:hypothetical protein
MDRDNVGSSHPSAEARQGDKETRRQGDKERRRRGNWLALLVSLSPCLLVYPAAAAGQMPQLPAPQALVPTTGAPAARTSAALPPLDLASVRRLVEEQNAQIAVARSRVHEAWVEKHVADQHCLGTAKQLEAEGKIWQQQVELSRVTSETLLDATGTYVDLLAARTGEAIALDLQKRLQDLHERAQKLAKTERGARVEVERIQAQLSSQQRTLADLRQQTAAAEAKLAYALGLDPETKPVLLYDRLMQFEVVDANPSAHALINRALATGPGIREMEALIDFLNRSIARASETNCLVLALAPHLRGRVCVVRAKLQTTLIAYQDLRGKLAAGVLEAREAIHSGREQIRLAEETVQHAERAYELSNERFKESVEGSSLSEVVLSLTTLSFAQGESVKALRAYARAQLRLWVLLGAEGTQGGCASGPPVEDRDCPIPHGGPQ